VPFENFHGNDYFSITVSDGYTKEKRSYNVQVQSVADPPKLSNFPSLLVNNDQEYYDLMIVLEDGDGIENLKYNFLELPNWLLPEQKKKENAIEIRLRGTPPVSAIGVHEVVFRSWSTDDPLTLEEKFSLNVKFVNLPPMPVPSSIFTEMNEEGLQKWSPMKATDPESSVDELIWSIVSPPNHGIAHINRDGSGFNYSPEGNFSGLDQFYLGVTDTGNGQASPMTVQVPVAINVLPVNDSPVFLSKPTSDKADYYSWTDTEEYIYDVVVFDSDWSWQGSPKLRLNSTLPRWAKWQDTGLGTARLSGAPGVLDEGNYSFSISATSGREVIYQNFNLEIRIDDYPPILTHDNGTRLSKIHLFLVEDLPGEETWENALSFNAINPDPEEGDFDDLMWSIHERPTSGALLQVNATGPRLEFGENFIYSQVPNFSGSDSFSLNINEGDRKVVLFFDISIKAVPDPPYFISHISESYTAVQGQRFELSVFAADDDKDQLDFKLFLSGGNSDKWLRIVNIAPEGQVTLEGVPYVKGNYSFTLVATDPSGRFAVIKSKINVQ
jgi:hypothetical protein